MEYSAVNSVRGFDFDNAFVCSAEICGDVMVWNAEGLGLYENGCFFTGRGEIAFSGFSLRSVCRRGRKQLVTESGRIRESKDKSLYKSDIPAFLDRLEGEEWDIFSFFCGEKNGRVLVSAEIADGGGEIFRIELICGECRLSWRGGKASEKRTARKLLYDTAELYLAAGDGRISIFTRMAAALTLSYYRSPVKIFPKLWGRLYSWERDSAFPFVLGSVIKKIPPEISEELRMRLRNDPAAAGAAGRKKRICALPVIMLRAAVLAAVLWAVLGSGKSWDR
ncbi:MAG: hypothetical protein NC120_02700 [Ruminococcus sp.]|nr:hypothetical protein [Ruminococcus sp.]